MPSRAASDDATSAGLRKMWITFGENPASMAASIQYSSSAVMRGSLITTGPPGSTPCVRNSSISAR